MHLEWDAMWWCVAEATTEETHQRDKFGGTQLYKPQNISNKLQFAGWKTKFWMEALWGHTVNCFKTTQFKYEQLLHEMRSLPIPMKDWRELYEELDVRLLK